MTSVPFSRLFSMSTFEAVRTLRHHRSAHPLLEASELVKIIAAIEPDAASHDYEAGVHLDTLVRELGGGSTPMDFYRACIDATIHQNPIWIKILFKGRSIFVGKLEQDQQQCFRLAGLLEDPPTIGVVDWWDRTSGAARQASGLDAMKRARKAEQLTLDRERKNLRQAGIDRSPKWMGLEDNTAGYDILSYFPGVIAPVNRLIEVKSTIASPLRFYVTRNEWDTATRNHSNYVFNLWDLERTLLYERTVADIAPHIPTDNGDGHWESVAIPMVGHPTPV